MVGCCPCLRWWKRRRGHYQSIGSTPAPGAYPAAAHGPSTATTATTSGAHTHSTVSPTLPGAVGLPTWVSDEATARCFGCAAAFDLVHRRHHCRRCRNVFCGGCTATERPVVLAGLRDPPVRVCMRCSSEVARENAFLDQYLQPLLEGGEMVVTRGLLLGRRTPVRLSLAPSLDRLEIREASTTTTSAPTATTPATAVVVAATRDPASLSPLSSSSPAVVIATIPLTAIAGVSEEGALGLVVLVDGGKQHRLECAGPAQRALFTTAVREAAKVVPLVTGFKARVEAEREQRAAQEALALSERLRREEAQARRQEKQGFRDAIAHKYGLAVKR